MAEVRSAFRNELIASYTYDQAGLRTSKTVGSTQYEYFYSGGQLRIQKISRSGRNQNIIFMGMRKTDRNGLNGSVK